MAQTLETTIWKVLWFLVCVAIASFSLQTVHFFYVQPYLRHQCLVADTSADSRREPCACDEEGTAVTTSSPPEPVTEQPVITLFTTMKASPDRRVIHNNTIINWAALAPHVLPVLYTDEATGAEILAWAKNLNWYIRQVPRSNYGIPVFKSLYQDAVQHFRTPFYAFANADILFDQSLVNTLKALIAANITNERFRWTGRPEEKLNKMSLNQLKVRPSTGGLLIVGRRTNVNVLYTNHVTALPKNINWLARTYGTLAYTDTQDYFITTADSFPWDHVPELVIGRPGYDNWMVVRAQDWKMLSIDASDVILAVHQTGSDGNLAGWSNSDKTLCLNRLLVGRFDYRPGHTKCTLWAAQRDIGGSIRVFKRTTISKDCARFGPPKKNKKCKV